jgi:hypothetical protein
MAIAAVVAGALVIGTWTFLRLQGVETWEATRREGWLLATAITALCVVPVAIADRNYDVAAPRPNTAPAIPGLFARGNGSFALADPGGPMPLRCCGTMLNRDATPVATDEDTKQDLLILLPVETTHTVTRVAVGLDAQSGLTATVGQGSSPATPALEPHTYDTDVGPVAPDGHHIKTGWVARVPVTVHPTRPWDIGGNRYPLTIAVTYEVEGDPMPRTITARTAVNAQVASGMYEMAAAGSILPLCCFAAAFVRWRRTR